MDKINTHQQIDLHNNAIPHYLSETYNWAYINPTSVKFLDNDAIVWSLLFLNAGRLMNRYLKAIQ